MLFVMEFQYLLFGLSLYDMEIGIFVNRTMQDVTWYAYAINFSHGITLNNIDVLPWPHCHLILHQLNTCRKNLTNVYVGAHNRQNR